MLLCLSFALVALVGFLSLCVDFGLKRLVDGELQRSADAAALAAGERLAMHESTVASIELAAVTSETTAFANANLSTFDNGSTTSVAEVQLGQWDSISRTFTASTPDVANAVRTRLERSSARGNGIPTTLARTIGFDSLHSSRTSIAYLEEPPPYALIGLDSFTARGILTVDALPDHTQGSIASNGDVTLNLLGLVGVTYVSGEVATRGSVRLPLISLTTIKQGTKTLPKLLTLPPVTTAAVLTINDNAKIASLLGSDGSLNVAIAAEIPSGTYCVTNFNMLVGALLKVDGPVTIFVKNNVNIVGTVLVLTNDPSDFKIRVAGAGSTVTIAANVTMTADIYAPKSNINILAGVFYTGRLIGKSIDILGTSFFFLRPNMESPELGRTRVTLVQ